MATKATLEKRTLSTNNYIALMAAAALMAVLVTGFILNTLGRDFVMSTKVIIGKQQAVNDLNKKIENANTLVDSYKNLGSKRDLIEHAMPNKADFPQIVTLINNAASAAGVRVKAMSTSPELAAAATDSTPAAASETTPKSFAFGVDIDGSYPRIRDFVKNLELSARPIKVDVIQIRNVEGSLRVSIKLTTYYQDEANLEDTKEQVK